MTTNEYLGGQVLVLGCSLGHLPVKLDFQEKSSDVDKMSHAGFSLDLAIKCSTWKTA